MTHLKPRLRFIDIGRSIAIILMLQGHFISLTFEGYREQLNLLRQTGTSGDIFFDWWCHLRGFTAPLFFTITGVVFVYLLLGNQDEKYFKQIRVRKGFRRAISIILWGYALQLNFKNIRYYLSGNINDRFFAFHVLQCIGFGILILLVLYGVYRIINKRIQFSWILLTLGFAVFLIQPLINSYGSIHFPAKAPMFIQNFLHGPNSIFPLTPWVGFVLFGGALGAIIREKSDHLKEKWFPIKFAALGLLIWGVGTLLLYIFSHLGFDMHFMAVVYLFHQVMEVTLLIAVLMYVERLFKQKDTMFMRMGQNTLEIYILHVIILYGAIIGIGLRTYFQKSLSFGEAIFGAILFILFFAFLTKILPWYKRQYRGFKDWLFRRNAH